MNNYGDVLCRTVPSNCIPKKMKWHYSGFFSQLQIVHEYSFTRLQATEYIQVYILKYIDHV